MAAAEAVAGLAGPVIEIEAENANGSGSLVVDFQPPVVDPLSDSVDWLLPADLTQYGLVPRTTSGLAGILTMPFLHGGWHHLLRNTVPLCLLLFLLAPAAVLQGNNILFWLLAVLVTIVLVSLVGSALMLRGLEVKRHLPMHGSVGEPLVIGYAVHRRRRRSL